MDALNVFIFLLAAVFVLAFLRELANKNPAAWFTLAALVVAICVGMQQGF